MDVTLISWAGIEKSGIFMCKLISKSFLWNAYFPFCSRKQIDNKTLLVSGCEHLQATL
jgi:hypothetical protein